jgi:hypothetical protein
VAAGASFLEAFTRQFPGVVSGEETLVVDEPRLEALLEVVEGFAGPDVECAMVGAEGMPPASYSGPEGIRKAWTDWLGGFERVRFRFEDVVEADRGFVALAKQIGTTRYGVELEQPSAMVCTFGDAGKLERIEFHLDCDLALRSAGLDPQSSQE